MAELIRVLRNIRVLCLQHELVVFFEFPIAKKTDGNASVPRLGTSHCGKRKSLRNISSYCKMQILLRMWQTNALIFTNSSWKRRKLSLHYKRYRFVGIYPMQCVENCTHQRLYVGVSKSSEEKSELLDRQGAIDLSNSTN